jgi:hypothetical protein
MKVLFNADHNALIRSVLATGSRFLDYSFPYNSFVFKFFWRHYGMFPEELSERRPVAEVQVFGDLPDSAVGFTEKDFGFRHQHVVYPFDSCFSAECLHDTGKISGCHTHLFGIKRYFVMLFTILKYQWGW